MHEEHRGEPEKGCSAHCMETEAPHHSYHFSMAPPLAPSLASRPSPSIVLAPLMGDHGHHHHPHHHHKMPLFFFLLLSFSCCRGSPVISSGQPLSMVNKDGDGANGTLLTYIVHVRKPKGMVFSRPEDREAWHKSFLPTCILHSDEPRMVYSYDKAISGFAARLTVAEVKAMEKMEGFLSAHPDGPLVPLTTYTPYFLGLNRANGLWNATKKGDGMIIGVVDTGINPFHVSFDDNGMPGPPKRWRGWCDFNNRSVCNNKLIGARNFVRAAASAHLPFDADGHGTHVASTAAGNFVQGVNVQGYAAGTAAGVAPRAHLAIYKASQSSELLAAIDQAIYDRVDVLSISMGSSKHRFFHQNGIAIGALAATEHGILVSCAAGNDGPFQFTVQNDAPWILTVGASTTDRALRVSVRLDNGVVLYGETLDRSNSFPVARLPLVFPGADGHGLARVCADRWLGGADVVGKVVLCMGDQRVPSHVPGQIVGVAGGAAMILANSAASANTISVAGPSSLPTVVIRHADAMEVLSYLRSWADPGVGFAPKGTVYGVRPFPAVASFSGRGPSTVNNGVPKPDIVAPGVNILGASLTGSHFDVMSGTSMATPHVSGVAALLKSLHPNWSPAAIKSAIMTTGVTYDSEGNEITEENGATAGIFAVGAGHVYPLRASDPGLIYDIHPDDYVRYLCGAGYGDVEVSMVARRAVTCATIKPISGMQLNYPVIALTMARWAKAEARRTVSNVGPAKSMYTAEVDFPVEIDVRVSPATLDFVRTNQKASFTLAFMVEGPVGPGTLLQGMLRWVSSNHVVKTPLSVYVV